MYFIAVQLVGYGSEHAISVPLNFLNGHAQFWKHWIQWHFHFLILFADCEEIPDLHIQIIAMLIFEQHLGLISEDFSHTMQSGIITQRLNLLDGVLQIVDFLEARMVHEGLILLSGYHNTLNPASMRIVNINSRKGQRNSMYPLFTDCLIVELSPEDILGVRKLKTEIWVLNIQNLHCDPFVVIRLLEINVLTNFK